MLRINDLFWTIQGEGKHAGRRALFVRMPYCNLSCIWCDTKFNSFTEYSEQDFINFASSEKGRFAVITGGEPSINKATPQIIFLLKQLGFEIAIESNGMFAIPAGIDFVTISPKYQSNWAINESAYISAHEFKYVVHEGFNWRVLERHDVNDGRIYSLSPEFNRFAESISEIINFIKENPKWKISLQTHKWMAIP